MSKITSQFKTHDVTVPNMTMQDKKTYSTRGICKAARKPKAKSAKIATTQIGATAV